MIEGSGPFESKREVMLAEELHGKATAILRLAVGLALLAGLALLVACAVLARSLVQ